MAVKVFFVGNILAGDDGIAPLIYKRISADSRLESCEMQELGVIGLDLLSYVEPGDDVLIVDAFLGDCEAGSVMLVKPDKAGFRLLSLHDMGINELIALASAHFEDVRMQIIGISVAKTTTPGLSPMISSKIEMIKEEVVELIQDVLRNPCKTPEY